MGTNMIIGPCVGSATQGANVNYTAGSNALASSNVIIDVNGVEMTIWEYFQKENENIAQLYLMGGLVQSESDLSEGTYLIDNEGNFIVEENNINNLLIEQ